MSLASLTLEHSPKFRILIVEDEALVALDMQIVLDSEGYYVVGVAGNAADAARLAQTTSPQLAIIDVNLANGDSGIDVASRLKDIGVPALFSSGNCPSDLELTVGIGCLHKPFDDQRLIRAVQMAQSIIEKRDAPLSPAPLDYSIR